MWSLGNDNIFYKKVIGVVGSRPGLSRPRTLSFECACHRQKVEQIRKLRITSTEIYQQQQQQQ